MTESGATTAPGGSGGVIEYVVNPEGTPVDDLTGTAFAHLDVRTLVSDARQGSEKVMVGRTIYPGGGGTHEHHLHPDAEEVVIVLSGRGWHRVGDEYYEIGPGDVVFVPVNTAHSAGSIGPEDMVILWVLGGVPSLERAGYESVPELPGIPSG
jgi:quercetin dioxygenase-like cupin family protein